MESIMQGTTPSVEITIDPSDFLLSDVTAIELYIKNGHRVSTYTMDDLTVDTVANTVTKTFTEEETTALSYRYDTILQGRFWLGDSIIGIEKINLSTADMLAVGV